MTINLSAYDVGMSSQPQNQTPATVANAASLPNKTNEEPLTNGRMFVRNVGSSSPPASDGTRRGIVESDAKRPPKSDGKGDGSTKQHNASVPPLNRGYLVPPIVGACKQCGTELTRKSRNGRLPEYCNATCRQKAFRARRRAEKKS